MPFIQLPVETIVLFIILLFSLGYVIHVSSRREERLMQVIAQYGAQLERIADELSRLSERQKNVELALLISNGVPPSSAIGVYDNATVTVGKDVVGGNVSKRDEANAGVDTRIKKG